MQQYLDMAARMRLEALYTMVIAVAALWTVSYVGTVCVMSLLRRRV